MGEFSGFALVPEQGAIPQKHQLDPDMQRRIEAMAARVDIRDNAAVMGFGARAQKEMGTFSDIALEQMLRQDIKPLESVMQTLAEQIKSCSFTAQAKGLFRRVFGGAAPLAEVQAAYEKAIPRINACADEMTDRRVALMRDSALLDRLYERNEGLYRELCSLIVVGDEVIAQARARGDKEQDIARMERRVQDLRITQVASTQLAAQIRAVQASDELTWFPFAGRTGSHHPALEEPDGGGARPGPRNRFADHAEARRRRGSARHQERRKGAFRADPRLCRSGRWQRPDPRPADRRRPAGRTI